MTSINHAAQLSSVRHAPMDNHGKSDSRPPVQPFARSSSTPRDRATQSLDELSLDVSSRLGNQPVTFPIHDGLGMVCRMGPGTIVCSGPEDFGAEIVNGRITDKRGQSDLQIATFLRAARAALN
jgi:hypothetical protein